MNDYTPSQYLINCPFNVATLNGRSNSFSNPYRQPAISCILALGACLRIIECTIAHAIQYLIGPHSIPQSLERRSNSIFESWAAVCDILHFCPNSLFPNNPINNRTSPSILNRFSNSRSQSRKDDRTLSIIEETIVHRIQYSIVPHSMSRSNP
jgi:hypothetical protein